MVLGSGVDTANNAVTGIHGIITAVHHLTAGKGTGLYSTASDMGLSTPQFTTDSISTPQ